MSLTVEELIRELENLPPQAEVRLAMQPSWSFEYSIGSVYLRHEAKPLKSDEEVEALSVSGRERYERQCENGEYADPTDPQQRELFDPIVYLTEESQLGYLPGVVKDNIGW